MTRSRESTLHQAAKCGKIKVVQKNLTAGSDINAFAGGYTPLMLASISGHIKIVKLLCDHDPVVNHHSN